MKISIVRLTDEEKKKRKIPLRPANTDGWSVWNCAPSSFDWHYDSEEEAYVYEGRVKVHSGGYSVEIRAGDFVTFPVGLSCQWEVLEKIVKVYRFN